MSHDRQDASFPPYSYVPGRFPHPNSDPSGHSFGVEVSEPSPPSSEDWHECGSYIRGIDLFNHGFYWEAHEAWEAAWIACGRTGHAANFLKALIKLAAAGVKAREGRVDGVRRHASRCLELLDNTPNDADGRFFGLDFEQLQALARSLGENAEVVTEHANADVTARIKMLTLKPRLPDSSGS